MVEGVEGKLGNGSGVGGIFDLFKVSRQVGGFDYVVFIEVLVFFSIQEVIQGCVWLICSVYCFYWLFLVCRFGGLGDRIEVVGVLVVGWVQCLIVLFFSVFQGSGLLSGQYIGELRVRRRRRMLVWMNRIVWECVLRMQSIFIFYWSLMMMILF